MIIHDTYLTQIEKILKDSSVGKEVSIVKDSWEMKKNSDYILDSETALELGSTSVKNASITLCTCEKNFQDKIIVIGNDIQKLSGKVENFAKVVMVSLESIDDENELFRRVKSASRARLGINFKGTMLKATSTESLECFRISKDAYKKGINLSIVGSALINKIKQQEGVKNVQVYYIVDNKKLSDDIINYQDKVNQATAALNHVFDGMELDCGSCAIKEVCDEVEGMRDSHKKQVGIN